MPAYAAAQKKSIRKNSLLMRASATWKENRKSFFVCAGFFCLSLSSFFGIPAVYPLCCLMTMISCEYLPCAAGLGIALGQAYLLLWGVQIEWWIPVSCLLSFGFSWHTWKKSWHLSFTATFLTLPWLLIYTLSDTADFRGILLRTLSLVLCWVLMPALKDAASFLKNPSQRLTQDRLLCIVLPTMMLLSGLAMMKLGSINLGFSAAFLLTLMFAHVLSGAPAVISALMCSIALLLSGYGASYCVLLPLCGFLCGLLHGKSRLMNILVCGLICLLIGYLLYGVILTEALLCLLTGGIVYLFLPRALFRKLAFVMADMHLTPSNNHASLGLHLIHLSDLLKSISKEISSICVPVTPHVEQDDDIAKNVCTGCNQQLICWRDQCEITERNFHRLFDALRQGQPYEDILEHEFENCEGIEQLKKTIFEITYQSTERIAQQQRKAYTHEITKLHYESIADALKQLVAKTNQLEDSDYFARQIAESLIYYNFPAQVQYVSMEDGHYAVGMSCLPFVAESGQDEGMLHAVSSTLGVKMRIARKEHGMLLLEEEPLYQVISGLATSCAVCDSRKKITPFRVENGDAVLMQTLPGGRMLFALSDGMGHGREANEESKKTLQMLSLCLQAGYSSVQALNVVNGIMLATEESEQFATADMCLIDLWNGHLSLHKLGASQTLLVQGQHVRVIEGEALPMGIIEHVIPAQYSAILGDRDFLILVSDGVADAFSDENALSVLIKRYVHEQPQVMADALLQDALLQQNGLPKDDMTVFCLQIRKNSI